MVFQFVRNMKDNGWNLKGSSPPTSSPREHWQRHLIILEEWYFCLKSKARDIFPILHVAELKFDRSI